MLAKQAKNQPPQSSEICRGESQAAAATNAADEPDSVGSVEVASVARVDANADSTDSIQEHPAATQGTAVAQSGGIKLGGLKLGTGSAVGNTAGIPAGTDAGPATGVDMRSSPDSAGERHPDAGAGILQTLQLIGSEPESPAAKVFELEGVDLDGQAGLDCIPATAPERVLPEKLSEAQQGFIKALDSLYVLGSDPEMFVNVCSSVMSTMQSDGNLHDMLADADVHTMLSGLRQQAGLARARKQEEKKTRGNGGGSKSRAKKNQAEIDDVANMLGALGFSGTAG